MFSRLKKYRKSINARIITPIILVTLVQSIVVISVLYFSVIKNTIDVSLISSFKNGVTVRKNYLETLITSSWTNLESFSSSLNSKTDTYLEEKNKTVDDIISNSDDAKDYLYYTCNLIPELIQNNHVNDAYFILNNEFEDDDNNLLTYIRTTKPGQVINNEIEVLYAPYDVWRYYSTEGYVIDKNIDSNKYSSISNYEFVDNAIKYISPSNENSSIHGYWSSLTRVSHNKVLTYSIPFYFNDKCLGVFGIGITETYLRDSLSKLNTNEDDINFAFIKKVNNNYQDGFKAYVDYSLPDLDDVKLEDSIYDSTKQFYNNGNKTFYYEEKIDLYNGEDIDGETWYIVGMVASDYLFSVSYTTRIEVVSIYGISFLIIILIYILIAYLISRPIVRVSNSLNDLNILNLPMTNVLEVDNLLTKINDISSRNISLNNKLNRLVEDSDYTISFFEYSKKDDKVTISNQFFDMLNIPSFQEELSSRTFIAKLMSLKNDIISSTYDRFDEEILKSSGEIVFFVNHKYYVRLKIVSQDEGVIATLIDLTREYQEKERIAHERDYDVLTGLLNRRGFRNKVQPLFEKEGTGSFFSLDVDNLKFLNDQYGHDLGDTYLKKVGTYLTLIESKFKNVLTCHVSGDEFIIYLYDYTDLTEEKLIIEELEKIKNEYIDIFNKKVYISLSVGVCRREKGISYEEVRKRADYTLYSAKNDGKNKINIFNEEILSMYKNESVMYDDLNKLILNELVDFAYQPIVDINNGEVLGYEALMRPTLEGLNPTNVLNAAKKYYRLYDIERITLFNATQKFIDNKCDKVLFINSISSQVLSDPDLEEYKKRFKAHFDHIIIELIEEDFGQSNVVKKKIAYINDNGLRYAIDDYGTGYNNIGMILSFNPTLVKIEGSLIRNIDKDQNKERLAKSIISYCRVNNIKVVAESVETIEELKLVKTLGVDYVQGYFLGRPNLEIKDISEEKKEILRNL